MDETIAGVALGQGTDTARAAGRLASWAECFPVVELASILPVIALHRDLQP